MKLPSQSSIETAGVEHAYDGMETKQAYSGSKEALCFEAGAYWMQTQLLKLNPDKRNQGPLKAKEGASEGIPEWCMDAARLIYNEHLHYSPAMQDTIRYFAAIILKHAPKDLVQKPCENTVILHRDGTWRFA